MKLIDLNVPKVDIQQDATWEDIKSALNTVGWNKISSVNWEKYSYRPDVQFRIAYTNSAFLLQYKVKEQSVRAVAAQDNGEVWKDSCVEFFVSPANDGIYYNFEFNCIGTCLLALGPNRHQRERAPLDVISGIRRLSSLGTTPFQERIGDVEWDLSVVIPFNCFFKPEFIEPEKIIKANFYKCGDDLTTPHFLSWQPIKTAKPDFHLPEFFGTLQLD